MTFAARTLGYMGPGGTVVNPLPAMSAYDFPTIGGANASVTFNTDGTISYVGSNSTGPVNWFTPTTPFVGSYFYIKFVLSSGDAWNTGGGLISGTIYALSTARGVAWTAPRSSNKTASVAVTIYADLAGTSQVSSGTITANVQAP
jgi:hypothetical protein